MQESWRERRRLLALSRSGWVDYDPARISSGGGVFERDAREVCLSPEALAMLGCDDEILSGEELVRAVLRMPADLLWNGGVGTYVKASDESHAEAGDRGNDSVRVNARELRVKVVAEGGNLGFTQRARVEFAVAGGRIQTDAIDNSGGVDLSDREVNCKVLLARRVAEGRMPQTERDRVLQECSDQTAAAVLEGSGAQGRCISLDLLRSAQDVRRIELAAEFLERHADLDRALEDLPDADTLRSRMKDRGVSYTRPELSVLLGYTKLLVKRELVASQALRQPELCEVRASYFPELLRERFAPDIKAHPLADEITATRLSNLVIDQAGVTLIPELCGALPVSVADVVSAYHTMDRLLEADALRLAIEAQALPEPTRLAAGLQVEASVREAARGLLGLERSSRLEPREFERRLALVRSLREIVAPEPSDVGLTDLVALGMDPQLAGRIERLGGVVRSLGVLSLAKDAGASLLRLVDLHTRIGLVTRITWIAERLARPGRRDRWERIVAENLQLEMLQVQRNLTSELEAGNGQSLQSFQAEHAPALARIEELVARIESESPRGLAALTVAAHHVRRLA